MEDEQNMALSALCTPRAPPLRRRAPPLPPSSAPACSASRRTSHPSPRPSRSRLPLRPDDYANSGAGTGSVLHTLTGLPRMDEKRPKNCCDYSLR